MIKPIAHFFSILVSLALLAGMAAARLTRPAPEDAEPYHRQVREAADALPFQIGDWFGADQDVPPAAIQMLQPNVLVSRRYRSIDTGRVATILLVHCKDARDLAGHYPPVCYPAHGWTMDSTTPRRWNVDGLLIDGTEYGFSFRMATATRRMVVASFMVLPGGQILPDMKGVRHAAADYTRHFYGAAQIQLILDARIPTAERDVIFRELAGAFRGVINALRREPAP